MDLNTCYVGDCRNILRDMAAAGICVQMCVTSPPYWGLRDYGVEGQIGLEPTLADWVDTMVEVFHEVREVLADDGTLWLNLGDGYSHGGCGTRDADRWPKQSRNDHRPTHAKKQSALKPKDLLGQPWRVAFALQDDGWYLRQDIIWHKPNPMPESVKDRCTKAHEYLFLLSKSARYYYNFDAMQEPVSGHAHARGDGINPKSKAWKSPDGWDTSKGEGGHGSIHRKGREKGKVRPRQNESFSAATAGLVEKRNKRSVWTVQTEAFTGAHFATFPRKLIEPCVLAGSRAGDVVLDPFMGSGTTAQVAEHLGRKWLGCELNPEYIALQRERLRQQTFTFDHDEQSDTNRRHDDGMGTD